MAVVYDTLRVHNVEYSDVEGLQQRGRHKIVSSTAPVGFVCVKPKTGDMGQEPPTSRGRTELRTTRRNGRNVGTASQRHLYDGT